MARTIVIGDIHGCAAELKTLLERLDISYDDLVISLGDVTDKGPRSREVIALLMQYGAVVVLGNHDSRYTKYHKKGLSADEVNAKKINDEYKEEYAKLAGTIELDWFTNWASLYTETEILGQTFTFTHAGIVPYINLHDPKPWHIGEAIRVRYLDADTHGFVRMVKIDKDKYPDEVASWRPEHDNVVEWQIPYQRDNYGIVVHGHIIVGPNPVFWIEQPDGTKKHEIDAQNTTKDSPLNIVEMVESGLKVISMDTGAHKGWNLTAMVIDDESGDVYFEQVEVPVCYQP